MLRDHTLRASSALAGLALLSACGKPHTSAAPPPPLAVETAALAPSATAGMVSGAGALKRRREITLSFRIPGVLTRLGVDDGDPVRRGQVVAAVDPTTVESALARAKADLDRARRDADRLGGLVASGAVSRAQYDTQKTALAAAEAAYRAAAFDRRWASLTAPVDGVVLSRIAQAGEVVQPGQAIVSVADDSSPLVLRIALADRDAVKVRTGQTARVKLDASPGLTVPGVVSRVAQRAGAASGAIDVEITIPPRPELRSGMVGSADIVVGGASGPGYLRAPAEAVLEAVGDRAFVYRIDADQRARRTPVRFGGFDGDMALIGGLDPTVRVITAGAGYVAEGQRVSVVDPSRLAGQPR